MDSAVSTSSSQQTRDASSKAKSKQKQQQQPKQKSGSGSGNRQISSKLKGLNKDSPEIRISKTLSYILRHNAEKEGVPMRPDGYVKVVDLLANPKLRQQNVDFAQLKDVVANNNKQRFTLLHEPDPSSPDDEDSGEWWIRASQGHSIKAIQIEMKPVASLSDITTGVAVHGTSRATWPAIEQHGLSKMKRNHVHLAQGLTKDKVVSGMRHTSDIFIFIDVDRAVQAGIKFWISDNGVILSEGDERGYIPPEFFLRVEDRQGVLNGWEEDRAIKNVATDLEKVSIA